MPTGPKGEKRPADVIGNAVKVMRIATGEEEDTISENRREERARQGRVFKGGRARDLKLTKEQKIRDRAHRGRSALEKILSRSAFRYVISKIEHKLNRRFMLYFLRCMRRRRYVLIAGNRRSPVRVSW